MSTEDLLGDDNLQDSFDDRPKQLHPKGGSRRKLHVLSELEIAGE